MLPRLILIADRFTDSSIAERTVAAASAGVPWVLLRDRAANAAVLTEAANAMVSRLRALDPSPLISITAELSLARALDVGLHLGVRDVSMEEARRVLPSANLLGFSAHDPKEIAGLANAVDYFFLSPIFESMHRPGVDPLGLDELARFAARAGDVPVFALGGVTPDRVAACLEAGAHGVAVRSGILSAADVPTAVHSYLGQLP